jgi:hypothetical protein
MEREIQCMKRIADQLLLSINAQIAQYRNFTNCLRDVEAGEEPSPPPGP